MAVTKAVLNLIDYSGESTSVKFYLPELETDGSNFEDITDALDLLVAGVITSSDLTQISTNITIPHGTGSGTPPSVFSAQRELAIRIKYRDTVTGRFEYTTVPGPVEAFYPPQGVKGDYVALNNFVFANYIIVLEANMVSQDGNAIEVVEGRLVGRNT